MFKINFRSFVLNSTGNVVKKIPQFEKFPRALLACLRVFSCLPSPKSTQLSCFLLMLSGFHPRPTLSGKKCEGLYQLCSFREHGVSSVDRQNDEWGGHMACSNNKEHNPCHKEHDPHGFEEYVLNFFVKIKNFFISYFTLHLQINYLVQLTKFIFSTNIPFSK